MADLQVTKERDWLITLVSEVGYQPVRDQGYNLVTDEGDFVYDTPQGRWQVTIRRIDG